MRLLLKQSHYERIKKLGENVRNHYCPHCGYITNEEGRIAGADPVYCCDEPSIPCHLIDEQEPLVIADTGLMKV